MEKVASLPTQILLMVETLTTQLQLAAEAQSLDAAREKLSAAVKLADLIHRTANDAAAEVGQNIAGAS
jgi:hypothetical protein